MFQGDRVQILNPTDLISNDGEIFKLSELHGLDGTVIRKLSDSEQSALCQEPGWKGTEQYAGEVWQIKFDEVKIITYIIIRNKNVTKFIFK